MKEKTPGERGIFRVHIFFLLGTYCVAKLLRLLNFQLVHAHVDRVLRLIPEGIRRRGHGDI